ncbi:DUF397 domain-containing protein [Actinomadura spongiicola]|uniref:DUF397 domain-containing protein n=1 Tax=Actinomadura spongiicola TaxID=2303421 RepID=A0A372GP98_9ACTN|nr:DUF397 domain-containing protein [Actinomadura spongiicola]RFS87218.1 DUF397 domain-containing protein [Actinomadura spongiicola]
MDLSKAVWRKASRSTSNGGDCIEVASVPRTIAIRDSKDPEGPSIIINHNDFRHLIKTIKNA